jgi:hypothetical protein
MAGVGRAAGNGAGRQRAALCLRQRRRPRNTIVPLTGLEPDTVYSVTSVDQGPLADMKGAELMDVGIKLVRSPGTAAHDLSLIPQP